MLLREERTAGGVCTILIARNRLRSNSRYMHDVQSCAFAVTACLPKQVQCSAYWLRQAYEEKFESYIYSWSSQTLIAYDGIGTAETRPCCKRANGKPALPSGAARANQQCHYRDIGASPRLP